MYYSVRRRWNYIDRSKPAKFFPYPRYTGKITLRHLAGNIAKASSLTRGDVESVILNLVDEITDHLKDGKCIQLDEFCSLRLSFKAEGADTNAEANHHLIKKLKLVFTPGKALMRQLKDVHFRRFS